MSRRLNRALVIRRFIVTTCKLLGDKRANERLTREGRDT